MDCNNQCNDECSELYIFFQIIASDYIYYAPIDKACIIFMDFASHSDYDSWFAENNCTDFLENEFDINNDYALDFREFVILIKYILLYPDEDNKSYQLNCSHCIGTENYVVNVN